LFADCEYHWVQVYRGELRERQSELKEAQTACPTRELNWNSSDNITRWSDEMYRIRRFQSCPARQQRL